MANITTYSGRAFDPIHPCAEEIDVRDIAHALSLLCRANGHFPTFYSIAQHSLHCAEEAAARGYSVRIRLACLLHDASEAYLSDLTRPVKQTFTQYREIEARLQNMIYGVWLKEPLSDEELDCVSKVDDALLYHEFFAHMGEKLFDTVPRLESDPVFAFEPFITIEKRFLGAFAALICEL